MRILVLSDTHRDRYALREALRQPKAEVLIHLGDGARKRRFLRGAARQGLLPGARQLRLGAAPCPLWGELCLEGKHIFTHGHLYEVKYGLSNLVAAAEARSMQMALFGHTHQAMTEYRGGLYLMNPGSLSGTARPMELSA